MPGPNYRFGPFFLDRTAYRLLRDGTGVDLTPKLLDLLLHLADNSGTLVTKEALLDALWPDANVTDNALAQAISELRQALDDDPGEPRFIKTVTRRGYRFIGVIERIENAATAAPETRDGPRPDAAAGQRTIAVMDFANVTDDADSAWLSAGIAETVAGDLRSLKQFRVVDRARVMDAARRTNGSLHEVAAALGVEFAVVGSFQRNADRIRITGRIVNVGSGEALADAKVDGPIDRIFDLQDEVVTQFSKDLGLSHASAASGAFSRETASLDAYRACTEGWLQLETLDVRELPASISSFERAIAIDPRYALAHTGLACAQLAAFEDTRAGNVPAHEVLEAAIKSARRGVALDGQLAEAHATLGFVLVSAWSTTEAVAATRRAVAIDPTNWRHFFRLGHASWGEERLRAAANTLALYPDFAFAHFQAAMVHVARGRLHDAETMLRQGSAVQDRQIARGERYPGLGLHWMLGLVRLAQDDVDEAMREMHRENELARPHRLYGREYAMASAHALGMCLLRAGRFGEASLRFSAALELFPGHVPSHIGLMVAHGASGSHERAARSRETTVGILGTLANTKPIEHAIARSQFLTAEGDLAGAASTLEAMLAGAPPGFAGWALPIEPLLRELVDSQEFPAVGKALAERAR